MTPTLDHFVMDVTAIEPIVEFYEDVPGIVPFSYDDDRWALRVGDQKINLHEPEREFDPVAENPAVGASDFCVVVEMTESEIVESLDERDVEVLRGPVDRTGAVGPIRSVYLLDPDGNLVEIATTTDPDTTAE